MIFSVLQFTELQKDSKSNNTNKIVVIIIWDNTFKAHSMVLGY